MTLSDRRLQLAHQNEALTPENLQEFARPTIREILHTRYCRTLRWVDPSYLVPIPKGRRDLTDFYNAIIDGQRDMFREPTEPIISPFPECPLSAKDLLND